MVISSGLVLLMLTAAAQDEPPVFERRKEQRQYEKTLRRIERLESSDGSETSPNDWFVVGGAISGGVNFDVLQGTRNVALRIVKFTTAYDNQCQWRIFYRTADHSTARELLTEVTKRFGYQPQRRARCGPFG